MSSREYAYIMWLMRCLMKVDLATEVDLEKVYVQVRLASEMERIRLVEAYARS